MKNILFLLSLVLYSTFGFSQNMLTGKVTDEVDGKALEGATIYIPDLKIGTAVNQDGTYTLQKIPAGTYMVEARFVGYALSNQFVKITGSVTLDLALRESESELQEVVVTGNSVGADIQHTPAPIAEVPNSYLQQNASTNIIDAISKVPGVSGITDGQSIAKPVIRGLGYNRVVTVNDGVRQEGQQWGDEFGIEVDQNSVDRIEILKGPASLIYGSDAISGVINLIPEKTLPEGQTKGDALYNYQTNNGLYNTMLHVAGNNNGVAWSIRASNIMAHAYQNTYDGYVTNSQFMNRSYDGTVGLHRSWGFTQLHYSYFDLQTGIVDGTRDSASGKLERQIAINGNPLFVIPTHQENTSYTPFVINQHVRHYKLVWDNSVAVGEGRVIGRFAWQQNSRQENNDPTIPDISNIYYLLNTVNYDVRYVSPDWHQFNFSTGANGMEQSSQNKGTLLLIPEYNSFDIGTFAIVNKKINNLNLSAGVRFDTRQFQGHDAYIDSTSIPVSADTPGALHRFAAYTSNFSGMSWSVGATYQFNKGVYLKANLAKGFRAPNVAETGSNGIHDGTVVYEIGDPKLKPEQSLEFDIAPGVNTKDITAEVDVFNNNISNYIFPKHLFTASGKDSVNTTTAGFGPAPVFKYTQGNSVLTGGEAVLDIHPAAIGWLDLYTGYSVVYAHLKNVPDSAKYLPFTPPARLRTELTITFKRVCKTFHNTYFRIGMLHSYAQTQVYEQSAVYMNLSSFELLASQSPTAAYTLFNAGIGTDIMKNGRKLFTVYIAANNLTDVAYMDYMSRFKYYPVNSTSNPERVGVFNMGRNISFKLLIPLDFSK